MRPATRAVAAVLGASMIAFSMSRVQTPSEPVHEQTPASALLQAKPPLPAESAAHPDPNEWRGS